jgi:hypothetical protein
LFCGGAQSIDKNLRQEGTSWWPQEVISNDDMEKLPSTRTRVDVVVSHTKPGGFPVLSYTKMQDPSEKHLDTVRKMFKPKHWYFGHFHELQKGEYEGTKWTGLADIAAGCKLFSTLHED